MEKGGGGENGDVCENIMDIIYINLKNIFYFCLNIKNFLCIYNIKFFFFLYLGWMRSKLIVLKICYFIIDNVFLNNFINLVLFYIKLKNIIYIYKVYVF